MIFYDRVVAEIDKNYPQVKIERDVRALLSPLLISEHIVQLPKVVLQQAHQIVKAFWQLRESKTYQSAVLQNSAGTFDPGNFSALMSYDFHLDHQQNLKLIEINTNASMALISDLVYRAQGLSNPVGLNLSAELVATFREEFRLSQKPISNIFRLLMINRTTKNYFWSLLFFKSFFKKTKFPLASMTALA